MGERLSLIKPAGHCFETTLDGVLCEADTWQCNHCGGHERVVRGSGRLRGFCTNCGKYVHPHCSVEVTGKCVPQEQMVDNMDAGRPLDFRQIIVSVPRSV